MGGQTFAQGLAQGDAAGTADLAVAIELQPLLQQADLTGRSREGTGAVRRRGKARAGGGGESAPTRVETRAIGTSAI
jgi:hypothetical protein